MMWVVAIIAADFGLYYHLEFLGDAVLQEGGMILILGFLPMANVIALGLPRLLRLGLPRLLRRGRRMPFAIGFQVTSWVSPFAVLAVYSLKAAAIAEWMGDFMPELFSWTHCTARTVLGPPVEQPHLGFVESCCNGLMSVWQDEGLREVGAIMVLFSLPPFLISVAGGVVVRQVVRHRLRAAIITPLPNAAT
jgi:hypothetical protein